MKHLNYDEFIQSKSRLLAECGFEPRAFTAPLFPWQEHVIGWAIRQGRAALFEDCGLGKTIQQLEWAHQVAQHTGGCVLILTPLSVARQTEAEARKFGIAAEVVSSGDDVDRAGVFITNYEKLEHFEGIEFAGVVLDESSILKSFQGKTRKALTERFKDTPYRLCCTATPSPNDYTELGQHADFLGICSPMQMLATYFINDTFNTGDWRLKKHAEGEFWKWLASWAACISKPSDIGYEDAGYDLPGLNLETRIVEVDEAEGAEEDQLFRHATLSATTMHRELRMTMTERVAALADAVNNDDEHWIVWCNTNEESAALAESIPGSVEVVGADHGQFKELAAQWFKGDICACETGKFRYKFTACHHLNTSGNITSATKPKSSIRQSNGSKPTERNERNTCASITPPISPKNGQGEPMSRGQNTTLPDAPTTQPALNLETPSNQRSRTGSPQTPQSSKLSGSSNTESDSTNTTPCFPHREEPAESADIQICQNPPTSLSLTTATPPERSGDSCACHAIKGLENSGTTAHCYLGQCNTSRRVLISKSSIFGFGLNLQHCRNVAFVGLSYSFEDFYQALRRCYRFGQAHPVRALIVQASTEGAILQSIQRKITQHQEMQTSMKQAAKAFKENTTKKLTMKTEIETKTGEGWTVHHGDCVRVAKTIPDGSIHFSVFSPPFADLFTYSDDLQDMGNCADLSEFTRHFEILIAEMKRIMMPGREVAVHCVDLLSTKWKTGRIEFQDFSGELIRAFWRHGFLFHSRICIWKSPVTEMQRTKAHGLLYKTLCSDSTNSRVGCADYLLIFKAPGDNPVPVTKDKSSYPIDWWQEAASPVWMTVDQGNVLNRDGARDNNDERHICPLQLDVIERAVALWSNPGELVYSPFTGIGSEGYKSLQMGRRFVGSELKESYFNQASQNLANATSQLLLL